MPYIFQKEIERGSPHHYTGCEKFDSLYQLYDIFKDSSYFLTNLFFGEQENLTTQEIAYFLKSTAEEYKILHFVVRCEKFSETTPVEAVAFSNINLEKNLQKCAIYIYNKTNLGYNCIVHEVITGKYLSNRLDWLYSFGIWYKNTFPQIEIYPATDASSIKWGKLSPLDFLSIDPSFNIEHSSLRDTLAVQNYQKTKINEWVKKFKTEINEGELLKTQFINEEKLTALLKKEKHPLFDFSKIDLAIQKTQRQLVDIAFKYSNYALEKNINLDQTIIHGSLLFNNRMIIWDISTDKRWKHLDKSVK